MANRYLLAFVLSVFTANAVAYQFPKGSEKTGKSPSFFLENKGQVTDQDGISRTDIDFKVSATTGLNVFIGKNGLHYQWADVASKQNGSTEAVSMYRMDVSLLESNPNAAVTVEKKQTFTERYYLASLPNGTVAHSFAKVTYHNVYPNIDWVLYFNEAGQLEHDFVIRPLGKVSDIKIQYNGSGKLTLNNDGSLTALTPLGEVREQAPFAYIKENSKAVHSGYILNGNILSYSVAAQSGTLVIDPVIDWGTYFGGSNVDAVYDVSMGKNGMTYATGGTSSINNMATTGAFQTTYGGGTDYINDAFLSKFDASGNRIWSTYYGTADRDVAMSIGMDTSGKPCIAGYTNSTAGLATAGAYQTTSAGDYDIFMARFDTSGQRLWGTYFGGTGSDGIGAMAVHCDRFNNIYLTGQTNSATGIATTGAFQPALFAGAGDQDAFLAKFNTTGSKLWGTYFGGNNGDAAYSATTDTLGNIYITGNTNSTTGIASTGGQQQTNAGSYDGFVAKFSPAGARLWSSFFGGEGDDYCLSITSDKATGIFLTGTTTSLTGVATPAAFQTTYGGGYQDGVLARFSGSGALLWSTYYGGSSEDQGDKVICPTAERVYLSGFSGSDTGMVTADAFQPVLGGYYDGFISRFTPAGSLVWGSYIGGTDAEEAYSVCSDTAGNMVIAGNTMSATGVSTSNAWQQAFGGGDYDAFLLRVKDCTPPIQPDSILGPLVICAGQANTYTVSPVSAGASYNWLLPTGWTGSSTTGSIQLTAAGTNGTLKVVAVNACSSTDTISINITINAAPAAPMIVQTGNVLSTSQPFTAYQWNLNGQPIQSATGATYTPTVSGSYTVTVYNANGCSSVSTAFPYQSTGIINLLAQQGITVYPNPVSDKAFVSITTKGKATLLHIDGRELNTVDLTPGQNAINLSGFAPGLYLIRLHNAKGQYLGTAQLVKSGN